MSHHERTISNRKGHKQGTEETHCIGPRLVLPWGRGDGGGASAGDAGSVPREESLQTVTGVTRDLKEAQVRGGSDRRGVEEGQVTRDSYALFSLSSDSVLFLLRVLTDSFTQW